MIVISTLFELTEFEATLPIPPNISLMWSTYLESTFVLLTIVVLSVFVVVLDVTSYPLLCNFFWSSVNLSFEPEPFKISILTLEASSLVILIFVLLLLAH